jgi:hypothetical protein
MLDRPLTTQEKDWLIRGLHTLGTGEYFGGGNWIDLQTKEKLPLDEPVDPSFLLDQIDNLRVIGQCECGEANCHTVQFQHYQRGRSVAIVCYHTEDKRQLIIHINEDSGLLAELEVI